MTMQLGSHGDAVLALQQALVHKGYFVGQPDGDYGERTWAAVAYFQSCSSIAIDGAAGPETVKLLGVDPHPGAVVMRTVEAHVDNAGKWWLPVSASVDMNIKVLAVFSVGSVQHATEQVDSVSHTSPGLITLDVPADIMSQKPAEVHVSVYAYSDPGNELLDEKSGSFFITD